MKNHSQQSQAKQSSGKRSLEDSHWEHCTQEQPKPDLLKAVALFYDDENAPTVTAKGQGAEAEEIIKIAEAHGVPLCNNELLVDLLSTLELGENIPEKLYTAVAHIIAFAYEIRSLIPNELSPEANTASPS